MSFCGGRWSLRCDGFFRHRCGRSFCADRWSPCCSGSFRQRSGGRFVVVVGARVVVGPSVIDGGEKPSATHGTASAFDGFDTVCGAFTSSLSVEPELLLDIGAERGARTELVKKVVDSMQANCSECEGIVEAVPSSEEEVVGGEVVDAREFL